MAQPARKIELEHTETTRPRDREIVRNATSSNRSLPKNDNVYRGSMRPTVDQVYTDQQTARVQDAYRTQTTTRAANDNEPGQSRLQQQSAAQRVEQTYEDLSPQPVRLKRPSLVNQSVDTVSEMTASVEDAAAAVRAKGLSAANRAWGLTLYTTIQLPLAVLSLVFFGFVYAAEIIKQSTEDKYGNLFSEVFNMFGGFINDISKKVLGFDFAQFDPANLFLATLFMVMLVGFSTMLIMGITYQLGLVNCLFGRGATIKITTFIFALFGYMVPLLNLFPWFIIWVWAVNRYPK